MGDTPPTVRRSRRRTLVLVAALLVVLYLLLSAAATVYTDHLWFGEVRYHGVFRTMYLTRIVLWSSFAALFIVLLGVNLRIARKSTPPDREFTVPEQISARWRATIGPHARRLGAVAIVVAGVLAGAAGAARWREFLLWRNPVSFGKTDPLFHKDLSFFVFKLPFKQFLYGWTLRALIVVAIASTVAHYVRGGIRPQRRGERITRQARAHLSVLLGLIVAVKALGYRLAEYGLVYSRRGVVSGASYADVHGQLPALRILVVVAIACAALLFVTARMRRWAIPILGLVAATSIVGAGLIPAAIQRFRVKPNERTLEQPYIQRNIDATRDAYGLNAITDVGYSPTGTFDARELQTNIPTLQNIRVWAPDVLQSVYTNLQRIKQYYQFVSPADVDRYGLDQSKRQVMIGAREISPNGLSPEAKTWVNTHLSYTHGYGLVASSANGTVNRGQPVFVLSGIPPTGSAGPIDRPQIYFGENEEVPFVVVDGSQAELDYPNATAAPGAVTNRYAGTGGIRVGGFLQRAAFAWRFRDLNLLLSSAITKDSRLLFRRQIAARVAAVAPFLQVDGDPYPALVNGRIVWIVDGYTTSNYYPYSQPADFGATTNGLISGTGNYIRDSVKFVVDALDGTVTGYVSDPSDPVLQAWLRVFPEMLRPASAVEAPLLRHVRYPEGIFAVQSDRFTNYHVRDATTFYAKEDVWLVARDPTWCLNNSGKCGSTSVSPPVPPYYALTALPDEPGLLQFVLVRPFTPGGAGRQNMISYLVAKADADDLFTSRAAPTSTAGHRGYGTMKNYLFPRGQQIFGPEQVEANINQDPAVTQQVSLWNQQHSKVIYGNLVIVPLPDTLVYVQPLYLRGEGSQIPELKRVVVVANGRVEMADTLGGALNQLLTAKD
jgi:uncharacterized membrane protein (UPF0182 family)